MPTGIPPQYRDDPSLPQEERRRRAVARQNWFRQQNNLPPVESSNTNLFSAPSTPPAQEAGGLFGAPSNPYASWSGQQLYEQGQRDPGLTLPPEAEQRRQAYASQKHREDVARNEALWDYLMYLPNPTTLEGLGQWGAIGRSMIDPTMRPEDMPKGSFLPELVAGISPAGFVQDIRDVYRDISQKNVSGWTLTAALPLFGDAARGVRRARGAADAAEALRRGARMTEEGSAVISIEHRGRDVRDLDVIDPAFQGTGQPGAELHPKTGRGVTHPESYQPRSFWNVEGSEIESRFRPLNVVRTEVALDAVYDGTRDPLNLKRGLEQMHPSERINLLEQRAREAGYVGIQYQQGARNEVHLFEPVPIHRPKVDIFDLQAAVRAPDGEIFKGENHADALDKLRRAYEKRGQPLPAEMKDLMRWGMNNEGFADSSGQWFSRRDANELFGAMNMEDLDDLRDNINAVIDDGRRMGWSDEEIANSLANADVPEAVARRLLRERVPSQQRLRTSISDPERVARRAEFDVKESGNFLTLEGPQGDMVVKKMQGGEVYHITSSNTNPKGQGIGTDMYLRMAEEVEKRGGSLMSDIAGRRTEDAERLWRSLVDKGLAHRSGDRYVMDPQPAALSQVEEFVSGDRPLFSVNFREIAESLLDKLKHNRRLRREEKDFLKSVDRSIQEGYVRLLEDPATGQKRLRQVGPPGTSDYMIQTKAVQRIRDRLATEHPDWTPKQLHDAVRAEVLEGVRTGEIPWGGARISEEGATAALQKAQQAARAPAPPPGAPTVRTGLPSQIPEGRNVSDPLTIGLEEAERVAHRGEHIVRGRAGEIVGAPEWVTNEEQILKMREQMDEYARRGESGRDWYQRQRAAIAEVAGPDPHAQELLAAQHGITSSQATPQQETVFTTRMATAQAGGAPIPPTRAGYQKKGFEQLAGMEEVPGHGLPFEERIKASQEISGLGGKTSVYGLVASNPLESPLALAPHDVWDRRAMGYAKPDAMTVNQRRFADFEQILGARRLGMTPQEYQASIWTTVKAEGLQQKSKKPLSWEDALEEAKKSVLEALPQVTGHEPYELVPAMGSGQLPGLLEDPALAREFSARSPWQDPFTGRDVLYDALPGMGQRSTLEAPGAYRNPAGELEQNPAFAARPAVASKTKVGTELEPSAEGVMQASTNIRGYTGVQAGSPYSLPISRPGRKPLEAHTGLVIPLQGSLTADEVEKLSEIFHRRGMYLSPGGDRIIAGPDPWAGPTPLTGEQLRAELDPEDMVSLRREVEGVLGEKMGEPQQSIIAGGYTGFEWGPEGTGEVTEQFLKGIEESEKTAPLAATRMLDDPRVKEAIATLERRTEEFGPRAGGYRQDVQNARRLLREGGIPALKRALKEGKVALPALVAMMGAEWVRENLQDEQGGLFR